MRLAATDDGLGKNTERQHLLLVASRTRLMPFANRLEQAGYLVRREEGFEFFEAGQMPSGVDWIVVDTGLAQAPVMRFCDEVKTGRWPIIGLTLLCPDDIADEARTTLCETLGATNSVTYSDSLAHVRAAIEDGRFMEAPTAEHGNTAPGVTALLEHIEARWDANDYVIMGVNRTDGARVIERAYHLLALNLHPDRHRHIKSTEPALFERFNRVFKRVNEVYLRLSNAQERNLYDLELWIRARSQSKESRWGVRREIELSMCRTARGRALVSRSLKERFFGQWSAAAESLTQAVAIEGPGSELAVVMKSIEMIRDLTRS
mgnify:CR=1 FL=1